MKLHNIAINNLRRRKAKMAFLILGMVIGIATIVTLYTITDAMKTEIADKFDTIGANMTIVPQSDSLSMSYEGISAADVGGTPNLIGMDDVAKIRTIKNKENISIVAPKLLDTFKVDNKQRIIMGVQFNDELRMKRWWKIDGAKPAAAGDILLGSRVALDINKKPGDTLEINSRQYKIAGVIQETGNQEDSVILMDLRELQDISGQPEAVSFVEVSALCSTCPIDDITAQISEKLPGVKVSAIREAVQARKDFVDRFSQLAISVSVIVLVIGALVVLITMMSSVNERTREIGIFRAIGFRKSHVMGIIFMEAGIVSLLGGLSGYLLGMLAAKTAGPLIAQMEVSIPWDYNLGLYSLLAAVGIGMAASFLPAYKASRQDPVEALRFI
ncbi:MAG: FtsX-like permease family protein [Thermincola sp.]|nr:FtsX-like permease family protein [Thermincola sp.]MDT3704956.1 FtsX-like permease family protein [Thermincola sp.]